jgi:hypothetical protein
MSHKTPVCRRRDYTIYLQEIEGTCWAHCDVTRWSHQTAKQLRADSDAIHAMQGREIFALNEPTGDLKHQKFMALMGFRHHKTLSAVGGEMVIFRKV